MHRTFVCRCVSLLACSIVISGVGLRPGGRRGAAMVPAASTPGATPAAIMSDQREAAMWATNMAAPRRAGTPAAIMANQKGRDSGGNHGDSKNGHAGGKHGSSKRVGTPALNRAARKRATMPVVSEVSLLAERVTPFPAEVIIANAMMAPERGLATITRRRVATLPLQAMLLGELAVTAVQLVTA
jgi:hypothetical protein